LVDALALEPNRPFRAKRKFAAMIKDGNPFLAL
jgi:hypothetical protein